MQAEEEVKFMISNHKLQVKMTPPSEASGELPMALLTLEVKIMTGHPNLRGGSVGVRPWQPYNWDIEWFSKTPME